MGRFIEWLYSLIPHPEDLYGEETMDRYSFGAASETNLSTCHEDLQKIARFVIRFYDHSIVEGHRTREKHEEYANADPPLTKVKYENGKHSKIPSKALHAYPYPGGLENLREMTYLAGMYHMAALILKDRREVTHDLRWGGDWDMDDDFDDQKWNDLGHFELI